MSDKNFDPEVTSFDYQIWYDEFCNRIDIDLWNNRTYESIDVQLKKIYNKNLTIEDSIKLFEALNTISKNIINPRVVLVYNPLGENMGYFNEYEFNDLLVQIKRMQIEGYYCHWDATDYPITKDGKVKNFNAFNMLDKLMDKLFDLDNYKNMQDSDFIEVDGGNVFSGTRDQFRNWYFDNSDDDEIKDWCQKNGWSLIINDIVIL